MVYIRGPVGLAASGARASGRLSDREDDDQRRGSFERVASQRLPKPPKMDLPAPQPVEESGGLLSTLGSGAMGVFGLLDLPGSMIRDIATLRNPLDQLLSPFDLEKNRISGEQMAKDYGLMSDKEPTSTLGKVGRFAGGVGLEILADPLTYMTGGLSAAVKAGKGAKALKGAGLIDDMVGTVNERLVKAGSKKAGRKVGKREALYYVSPKDIAETTLTGDEVGRAFRSTRSNKQRFDAAVKQDLKNLTDEALEKEKERLYTKTLKDVNDGYFRFSVPFKPQYGFGTNFGLGAIGLDAKKLARFEDKLGDVIQFGEYSPVRMAAPIFSATARKAKTAKGQRQAAMEAERLLESQAIARERMADSITAIERGVARLMPVGEGLSKTELTSLQIEKSRSLREKMMEYIEDIGREREIVSGSVDDGNAVYRPTEASFDSWRADKVASDASGEFKELEDAGVLDALDDVKAELRGALQYAEEAGVDLPELQDVFASYMPRSARPADKGAGKSSGKVYDPNVDASQARVESRRNITGGTAALQRMSYDPQFAATRDKSLKGAFKEKYAADLASVPDSQVDVLFSDIINRSKDDVGSRRGFYDDDISAIVMGGLESLYRAGAKASGLREFLRREVRLGRNALDQNLDEFRDRVRGTQFARDDADKADEIAIVAGRNLPTDRVDVSDAPEGMDPDNIGNIPDIFGPDRGGPLPPERFPDLAQKASKRADEMPEVDAETLDDIAKGSDEQVEKAVDIADADPEVLKGASPETERRVRKAKASRARKKKATKKKTTKKTPAKAKKKPPAVRNNPRPEGGSVGKNEVVFLDEKYDLNDYNNSQVANKNLEVPEEFDDLSLAYRSEWEKSQSRKFFGKDSWEPEDLIAKLKESKLSKSDAAFVRSVENRPLGTIVPRSQISRLKKIAKTVGMDLTSMGGNYPKRIMASAIIDKDLPKWAIESLDKLRRGEEVSEGMVNFLKQNQRAIEVRHPDAFFGVDFGRKAPARKAVEPVAEAAPPVLDTADEIVEAAANDSFKTPSGKTVTPAQVNEAELQLGDGAFAAKKSEVNTDSTLADIKQYLDEVDASDGIVAMIPASRKALAKKIGVVAEGSDTPADFIEKLRSAYADRTRDVDSSVSDLADQLKRADADAVQRNVDERIASANAGDALFAADELDSMTVKQLDALMLSKKSELEAAGVDFKAVKKLKKAPKVAALKAVTTPRVAAAGKPTRGLAKKGGLAGFSKAKAVQEKAKTRVGLAGASDVARLIDQGAEGYTPKLSSASADFGSIVEERKLASQTLEEFVVSDEPAMRQLKQAMFGSGSYEDLVLAARAHDQSQKQLSLTAMTFIDEPAARDVLSRAFGVELPQDIRLSSGQSYDQLLRIAKDFDAAGNPTAASAVMNLIRPLSDINGNMLGSFDPTDYSYPHVIGQYAERITGRRFLKDTDYDSIEELIDAEPESFADMVYTVRDKIDSRVSGSTKFSDEDNPRKIFYQTVEAIEDEEGFFEVPFLTRTIANADRLGRKPTAKVTINAVRGLGVTPEEIQDLGLEQFFSLGRNGVRTKQELIDHINDNVPQIKYVNLGKTNRVQFSGHQVPGGDPQSYVEIIGKMPVGGRGGGYIHIPTSQEGGHYINLALPEEGLVSGSQRMGRDTATNQIFHIRGNVIRDASGKKFFRIQENQGDMMQRMQEFGAAKKKLLNKYGLEEIPYKTWKTDSQIEDWASKQQVFTATNVSRPIEGDEILELKGIAKKYQRNKERLDALGMDDFDPNTPFQKTSSILAMKVAMYFAMKNGLDGIALVDGNDIGMIVGNRKTAAILRDSYDTLGREFEKYLNKTLDEKSIRGEVDEVVEEAVEPDRVKSMKIDDDTWSVGNDADGIPVVVQRDPVSGSFFVLRDGVPGTMDDLVAYRGPDIPMDELIQSEAFDSFTEAKEFAVQLLNEGSQDLEGLDLSGLVKKWSFTDSLKDKVLKDGRVTMYQSQPLKRNAAIVWPSDVGTNVEEWMNSQYKTQIIAFDSADAYSFAHEMGHLWRASLAWKDPDLYQRAKSILGLQDDNWDQFVMNPVLGKETSAEEAFADLFMQWFKDGGQNRIPEGETDSLWQKFRDFIGRSFQLARMRGQDRDMTQEMHLFLDDLLGPDKNTKFADKNLMDVLDKMKYSSPRALSSYMQDASPDDLRRAEEFLLKKRIISARAAKIKELTGKVDNPEVLVPSEEDLFADLVQKVRGSNQVPDSVDVGSAANEYQVTIDPRVTKRELLSQFELPEDIAGDVQRVYGTALDLSNDEVAQAFVSGLDKSMNVFKSSVTTPWPAFHVRNLFGALVQYALNDVYDPHRSLGKRHLGVLQDGANLLVGNKVENLDKIPYLAGKEGDLEDEVRKLAFAFGVFDTPGQHRDLLSSSSAPRTGLLATEKIEGRNLAAQLKNYVKRGMKLNLESEGDQGLRGLVRQANPANVAGGLGSQNRFIGQRVGIPVGDLTEGTIRLGGFISLLKQGIDPAEAAKRVRLTQVDYTDLTDIERRYLRRAFPFYTFAKGMQKYLINELATRPGGKVTQTIRAQQRSGDNDGRTPDYISRGTAVKLPDSKGDGTRNYITGFGLMHEPAVGALDALGRSFEERNLQPALFNIAAASNPVTKGMFEYVSGTSLFRESQLGGGEKLSNLDPPVGRMLSNVGKSVGLVDENRRSPVQLPQVVEVGISNSPLSRAVSTVRSLTDERKTIPQRLLNFGTGLRITSLSPEKQEFTLQQRAEELMRDLGGRSFERMYIPTERLESLPPAQQQKAQELNEILKVLDQKRRHRAALKKMQDDQLK